MACLCYTFTHERTIIDKVYANTRMKYKSRKKINEHINDCKYSEIAEIEKTNFNAQRTKIVRIFQHIKNLLDLYYENLVFLIDIFMRIFLC